jgi:hypothetical protein
VQKINLAAVALFACRVFAVLTFAVPTLASESNHSLPQPVERASADDCAIPVEVGKNQMNWGVIPPDFTFYSEFDRDGGGTYVEDCPWKELGVAEPLRPSQQTGKDLFITRPAYRGDEATVSLQYSISGRIVDGKKTRPFIRRNSLRKRTFIGSSWSASWK